MRSPPIDEDLRLLRLETWVSRAISYRTHVALVDGLLIDSGFAQARRKLMAALEGQRVEQVVNTHPHEDHCGNNHEVAERFGATLHAPAGALPSLAHPEAECVRRYQRIVWGLPTPSYPAPLGEQVRTRRFTFRVVPTPGHEAHHVCFHEPERGWLFGGDLFLAPRVRLARAFENARDLIASLERVLALRPRRFFCYHRGPLESPLDALRLKLEFLQEMDVKVQQLHREGLEVKGIARRLLGPEPLKFKWLTEGDFSQEKLVASFLKRPGRGYAPQAPGSHCVKVDTR